MIRNSSRRSQHFHSAVCADCVGLRRQPPSDVRSLRAAKLTVDLATGNSSSRELFSIEGHNGRSDIAGPESRCRIIAGPFCHDRVAFRNWQNMFIECFAQLLKRDHSLFRKVSKADRAMEDSAVARSSEFPGCSESPVLERQARTPMGNRRNSVFRCPGGQMRMGSSSAEFRAPWNDSSVSVGEPFHRNEPAPRLQRSCRQSQSSRITRSANVCQQRSARAASPPNTRSTAGDVHQ